MLVAVVDGTPANPGSRSIACRYGACSRCASRSRWPRPSTRNTTYREAGGRLNVVSWKPTSTPSARATAGSTSPSVRPPYAGSTNGSLVPPLGIVMDCRSALRAHRERLGEGQQPVDRCLSVGRRAEPQREVVGGNHTGVAVVGLALRVGARRRLEVDAVDAAPADRQDRLGRRRH